MDWAVVQEELMQNHYITFVDKYNNQYRFTQTHMQRKFCSRREYIGLHCTYAPDRTQASHSIRFRAVYRTHYCCTPREHDAEYISFVCYIIHKIDFCFRMLILMFKFAIDIIYLRKWRDSLEDSKHSFTVTLKPVNPNLKKREKQL